MTSNEIDVPEPGRRVVLESTPPGLWLALLGGALAVLAPLLGFLVGSVFGVGETTDSVDPMFLSLFIGIVVGGVGVLVALAGVNRLWKHSRNADAADEDSRLR
ncbi:hypothetical protein [Mycolicibacterium pyrenivorans]|uniref:hypothetical protein n=1 Tax=Mycolicibacterium pyrenivorans TaxID=187102 RepID=UPI0021F3B6BA|nr:hypothetical protein [Mycolicibacterium pyrenivorans]MCV7150464.1 hypothetical protein [Mycolicibacterium pyrenivorans]